MSATDGFTDLPYSDYPSVDSDERYLYRNIQLDDIPYLNTFHSLFDAVQKAASDSDRTAAWESLEAFRSSDDYINHVEPCIDEAIKWQRLEDCILACQRLAKRQAQQWVVSDGEPEDMAQAANDIWFKPTGTTNDGTANYTMYRKTDSGYAEMSVQSKDAADQAAAVNTKLTALTTDVSAIKLVSALPGNAASNKSTLYLVSG